jgi:hypothetical protein
MASLGQPALCRQRVAQIIMDFRIRGRQAQCPLIDPRRIFESAQFKEGIAEIKGDIGQPRL